MDTASAGYAAFGGIILIFGVILSILWILVPFAVFGIKGLLRQLIVEQRKSNELLANIAQRQQIVAEAYLTSPLPTPHERPVPPPL